MSFLKSLMDKYQQQADGIENDDAPLDNPVSKMLKDNILPADHIVVDDKVVNIYLTDVSLSQIANYFKERLPFIRITVRDDLNYKFENRDELLNAKFVLFSNLAYLLEEVSVKFNGVSKSAADALPQSILEPEYMINGRIYH